MSGIYIDTAFLIALANPRDSLHAKVLELKPVIAEEETFVCEEVLIEFLNSMRATPNLRQIAVRIVDSILKGSEIEVIPQSTDIFVRGLDLYRRREDKKYSMTDCITMSCMMQTASTRILSSDRHFEQEAFQILIR